MSLPKNPSKIAAYLEKLSKANKGKKPWNEGLKASDDVRVLKNAQNISKVRRKLFKNDYEKYVEGVRKGGFVSQQKHPEIAQNLAQWNRDNPEHSRQVAISTHQKYPRLASKAGKISAKKRFG